MFSTIGTRPFMAAAAPAKPPASKASRPHDSVFWSGALALPDYFYGGGAAALSSAAGFANRFPAGGVTINPGGIIQNPDWTRSFEHGTLAATAQPIVAGLAAGVALARGLCELQAAGQRGSARLNVAGGLDLALAASSAASMVWPGVGGAVSLGLFGARLMVDLLPDH